MLEAYANPYYSSYAYMISFTVLYSSRKRLSSSTRNFLFVGKNMFEQSDSELKGKFYQLNSRMDVSSLLEIDDKSLRYFLYAVKPEEAYRVFKIKKKKGSFRTICAPTQKLKAMQRKLAYILDLIYEPKICAYGFIKDKNILDNAHNHTKRKFILNIDLKDFFTQIHFGRIRGMLLKPPYNLGTEAATVIAQISCFQRVLPQGSPVSPVLTNMICKPFDNQMMSFCKKHGVQYTRYADDITISTFQDGFHAQICNNNPNDILIGKGLNKIISSNGFTINEDKIFLNSRRTRQEVTGLVVNQFPNIKRERIKELRSILHHCENDLYKTARLYIKKGFCKNANISSKVDDEASRDEISAWFKLVLKGKVSYIKQIKGTNSLTFYHFAKKLNDICGEEVFDLSEFADLFEKIEDSVFILISESNPDEYMQGTGFFIKDYGLITNFHVTKNGDLFKGYKHTNYPDHYEFTVSKGLNELNSDETIDYALYSYRPDTCNGFGLGDSSNLKIGQKIIIIGYPNYAEGNSPYVQTCHITSKKLFFGAMFCTVSGRIVHGASGGVVLNENEEIIGIIKGGIVSFSEDDINENQGFVPIHCVLEHLKNN